MLWPIAQQHWPVALAFSFPLAVYVITLAPTFFGLDSAELSVAAYRLGVPHATGYPLYVLVGKLFSFLPVGDVGYRLNLMSAVFAAAATAVLYLLLFHLTARVILSLAVSLFFAFSYYFWTSSVIAEVYTLHVFLTSLILLTLLLWERRQDRRLLYAAAGVLGLSFGNHMSTALLGPAFGYMLLVAVHKRALAWRDLLPMGGLFCLGLLTYAYLPWRYLAGAVPHVGHFDSTGAFIRADLASVDGMWWMLSGKMFHTFLFPYDFPGVLKELGLCLYWLSGNFLGVGVVFGLAGMVHQALTKTRQFIFLFLAFAANVLFFINYGVIDKYPMYLPAFLVWAIWMALGFRYFLDTIRSYRPIVGAGFKPAPIEAVGQALTRVPWERMALVLPIVALVINFSSADVSSDRQTREQYTGLLMAFEDDALVLGRWAQVAPMTYLQLVDGLRPDVQVINRLFISREDEARLLERARFERPVYIFGPLPLLSSPYYAVPFQQGYKLLRSPPPATP